MGLVPNLKFMRINTKSPKFSQYLSYHTQRMMSGYFKTDFLPCLNKMGGTRAWGEAAVSYR